MLLKIKITYKVIKVLFYWHEKKENNTKDIWTKDTIKELQKL
jgi:hypothetical protein